MLKNRRSNKIQTARQTDTHKTIARCPIVVLNLFVVIGKPLQTILFGHILDMSHSCKLEAGCRLRRHWNGNMASVCSFRI